ncbi:MULTISPECIES: YiiD C-terminal domain-containing protein [Nocardioides]|uniref:YiiD C-terminal domain-containing protein n=1 Tax=Nocardioides vastitatis TaxID=2568655 RepID=A0ABW0ZND0_9ACTN|nr:YiiD C-terminal domain-containing protein [Nocardioides sp.]
MIDLAELTTDIHRLVPILAAMRVEVVEAERGSVAARLPAGPNVNHVGTSYAGSLFSVAEILGGLFARTSLVMTGAVPIVKSVQIDFRRPATTDVVARATLDEEDITRVLAEARDRGKSDFVLEVEVTDEAGIVVATTRGVYQLRRL